MHPWAMVNIRVFIDILILGLRTHSPFYIMQYFFSKDFFSTGSVYFLKVIFTEVVIYKKDSLSDFINLNCSPLHCAYKGNEEAD